MDNGTRSIPLWVRAFTQFGRPVVAVVVLVMCAPAEHHLAVLVGWDQYLGWGMALVMASYGGMAAAVASFRPDQRSAAVGAVLALLVAMCAQTTAHLIATHHLGVTPVPVWLVVMMSCAPASILGHLLHLAWVSPNATAPAAARAAVRADTTWAAVPAPAWPVLPLPGATVLAFAPRGFDDRPEQPGDSLDGLATVAEVSGLTGRAESTVRGWIAAGRVTVVRMGNRPLIVKDTIPVAVPDTVGQLFAP